MSVIFPFTVTGPLVVQNLEFKAVLKKIAVDLDPSKLSKILRLESIST